MKGSIRVSPTKLSVIKNDLRHFPLYTFVEVLGIQSSHDNSFEASTTSTTLKTKKVSDLDYIPQR